MKKLIVFWFAIMLATVVNAKYYGVGTSTTGKTDIFGNTKTTYKDSYGKIIGTSTSGQTDVFGNTKTKHRSNNSNTSIRTW